MSAVDVSEWQARPLNFKAMHQDGVGGVIFRLGYGLHHWDEDTNHDEVHSARYDADLHVGGYWYALPNQDGLSGGQACNKVMNRAEKIGLSVKHPHLRLALDVEDTNGKSLSTAAKFFTDFIRHFHHHRGYWPIWYCSPGFMNQLLPHYDDDDLGCIKQCSLWEAHYTSQDSPQKIKPWGDNWRLWQFTDSGEKGGTSPIDVNKVAKPTDETWNKLMIPK